jgi:hypothetical protein
MKNKKRNERRSNEREKEGVRKRGGEDSDRRRSKKMYAAEPSRALDADEHFSLLSLFRYGPNEPIPVS